jgi:hypothetical protein
MFSFLPAVGGCLVLVLDLNGGKEYARVLPQFLSESNIDKVCSNLRCPDVVTGMLLTLLGIKPMSFPRPWYDKISHVAVDGY